jgi:hypothetical protein
MTENSWAVAAGMCAVAAFIANALNFWQSREVKMALLQMQIALTNHKLEVFQETKKETEPLRESVAQLETQTATLGVRLGALESARSPRVA